MSYFHNDVILLTCDDAISVIQHRRCLIEAFENMSPDRKSEKYLNYIVLQILITISRRHFG